ncbi:MULTISPECIES: hypothetical protein [unclassified Saccharopolyspora]|uniref:hypothetical protein n=1 Tax=unclassified Saccharopolyspora TaxID=2646250 RepID=UPI001CD57AE5|nr:MULTISPECIES: hypothetical protein [unclassified Saccharopolyspora]MCA1187940.1 hypothetical protein [Saccharopolyspora sp. 6T]MCA1226381.1 hypothetical protein [Saccharopolyspora sp. 6M]MCA1279132.1 hypothetical protein [Saccharopolyspora sp. 7B]
MSTVFPTAESLLSGPRGRRCCLELALSSGDDERWAAARRAVFFAAHHVDAAAGKSVLFGTGPDVEAPPHPSNAEIADLLAALPPPEPGAADLVRVLAEAVAAARYWQEPDGKDVLAAAPPIRAALEPAAVALAGCAAADWWTSPLDREFQRLVTFRPGTSVPGPVDPEGALARWRTEEVSTEERARREWPRSIDAPFSAIWWSGPPCELPWTTRNMGEHGPGGLWFVEDGMGWEDAAVHSAEVPPDAEVYEIDGPEAWARLCRDHPLEVSASHRHDWYRTTGRDGRWVLPDWSEVARHHDAVHLTVTGYLTTAGIAIPVDGDRASVLAGWDPDATCWLTTPPRVAATGNPWHDPNRTGWRPHPAG